VAAALRADDNNAAGGGPGNNGKLRNGVILGLGVPELVVFTVRICQQFLMRANLNDFALVEHGDLIAEAAGGQAVADIDCSLIAYDLVKLRIDFCFGNGVKRGSGLIQDDEGRILVERSGKRDFLRFTTGNIDAILVEVLIERSVQLPGQLAIPLAESDLI